MRRVSPRVVRGKRRDGAFVGRGRWGKKEAVREGKVITSKKRKRFVSKDDADGVAFSSTICFCTCDFIKIECVLNLVERRRWGGWTPILDCRLPHRKQPCTASATLTYICHTHLHTASIVLVDARHSGLFFFIKVLSSVASLCHPSRCPELLAATAAHPIPSSRHPLCTHHVRYERQQ